MMKPHEGIQEVALVTGASPGVGDSHVVGPLVSPVMPPSVLASVEGQDVTLAVEFEAVGGCGAHSGWTFGP
jgi:hypothetical protein